MSIDIIFILFVGGFIFGFLILRYPGGQKLNLDIVNINRYELARLKRIEKASRKFLASNILCQTEDSYVRYIHLCDTLDENDKS